MVPKFPIQSLLKDYKGSVKSGVLILITGYQPPTINLQSVIDTINEVKIRSFVIYHSEKKIPEQLYNLTSFGNVWSVSRSFRGHDITSYISEIFMGVVNSVESKNVVKIHSQVYHQSEVEETFSLEHGLKSDLFVMLYIDDEMKVESLELTDPSGNKNIFARFDTGTVYFRLTNDSDIGVWSFKAKLYHNVQFPEEGFCLDVRYSKE